MYIYIYIIYILYHVCNRDEHSIDSRLLTMVVQFNIGNSTIIRVK